MNGSIYAIKNESSDNVYIGSTIDDINKRFIAHRASYNRYLKGKFAYLASFEILKCPTAYIEYIEGCDIDIIKDREQYWIDNTPNCINILNANRDKYNQKLKEYKINWQRQYRANKKATQSI